jgi:phospholipase C
MTEDTGALEAEGPENPDQRLLLSALAAAVGAAAIGSEEPVDARSRTWARVLLEADAVLARHIETVVVIYAENRSFNNLFAGFPGLQHSLSALTPDAALQRDRDGAILPHLPPIWGGLVPNRQTVEHRDFLIGPGDFPTLPKSPFPLQTADGDPLPLGLVTRDLVHAFYTNQRRINGGRNDGYVVWGDSGAHS